MPANDQITAISQTLLRTMPPGTTPPLILQYNASSVPILQLGVGSKTLAEGQLFDYAQNFIRTQLATVQGAAVTFPYGGKPRQVMVDLDPHALQGKGLTAADVVGAVSAQNLVLPTGTAKIGNREYPVLLNSSPDSIAALNDLPIKQVNGSVVYVRDVAQVHDGAAVQQNIVATDGQRGSLLSILKGQGASTLAIVQRVKAALPAIQATLPPELTITPLFDQSIFVRAALDGVIREAAIAAVLASIRPGLPTDTVVREFPDRVFKASVFSTAEALDPASRTLLTEIRMPNEGAVLRPGMYADVKFHVTRADPPFLLPSTAVIIRSGPPRVAVVGADGVAHLHQVQLGRDLGSTIEITSGLGERDTVILTPADDLQDGARVNPGPTTQSQRPA